MKHLEKLKEALCEELDKFGKSGDITVNSLEKIHKLTDTIKNIDKIMALEEEFDIEIPDTDAEKVVTVGDVVEYIKENV